MRVKLPPVLSVSEKSTFGAVTQLREPEKIFECNPVRFTLEKSTGYVFTNAVGKELAYLFATKPKASGFAPEVPVLIAKNSELEGDEVDLSDGQWWKSTGIAPSRPTVKAADAARASWRHAFNFALEDPERFIIGLRKPQLGALHAVHAHWSTSSETATIVMPTGTGKTETMLSVLARIFHEHAGRRS